MLDYEEIEEDVCKTCKKYITDEFSGGNGWVCEGSYCDQAQELYLTAIPKGIKFYRKKKLEKLKNHV
jgi:hypothetical protein